MSVAQQTVAERLAEFAVSTPPAAIPESVLNKAKLHTLDAVGIAACASVDPIAASLRAYLERRPPGDSATIFGTTTNIDDAVLVNSALIHALDYDDTDEASLTHPSAPIIPAVLAVGAAVGASGEETLAAIVIGFEAITALGAMACQDFHSQFHTHGFHPTAVCGAPAVALATSRLLDLDSASAAGAVAIAACLAGGASQVISRGLRTKMLNVGRAATTGVFAAEATASGFSGGRGMLEDERGFFDVLAGARPDSVTAIDELGVRWRTLEVAFKEFPAGFGEHPFIRAALAIAGAHSFAPEDVVEVVYGDLASQIANASEPADEKRHPASGYHGKFSRYYCIASALARGHATVADYSDEAARDPVVIGLAEKTRYERSLERWLRVQLQDGRILQEELPGPVASLDNESVRRKFHGNCDLADRDGQRLAAYFDDLWSAENVRSSASLLLGATR